MSILTTNGSLSLGEMRGMWGKWGVPPEGTSQGQGTIALTYITMTGIGCPARKIFALRQCEAEAALHWQHLELATFGIGNIWTKRIWTRPNQPEHFRTSCAVEGSPAINKS